MRGNLPVKALRIRAFPCPARGAQPLFRYEACLFSLPSEAVFRHGNTGTFRVHPRLKTRLVQVPARISYSAFTIGLKARSSTTTKDLPGQLRQRTTCGFMIRWGVCSIILFIMSSATATNNPYVRHKSKFSVMWLSRLASYMAAGCQAINYLLRRNGTAAFSSVPER